jgi:hypothetical protein
MHIVRYHKRNRALVALFFPVSAVLFLFGWGLSLVGSHKPPRKTTVETDNVHLEVITLEETPEIAN